MSVPELRDAKDAFPPIGWKSGYLKAMQHKGLKYWARVIVAMTWFADLQDRRKVITAGLFLGKPFLQISD